MCGASKTAGREKRSRGLGDDGGGWKSSKRVEVARALVLDRKRSSFFYSFAVKEESVFCLMPCSALYICHSLPFVASCHTVK